MKVKVADVTMERRGGWWVCSTDIKRQYYEMRYLYYSKREANKLFRDKVNAEAY